MFRGMGCPGEGYQDLPGPNRILAQRLVYRKKPSHPQQSHNPKDHIVAFPTSLPLKGGKCQCSPGWQVMTHQFGNHNSRALYKD